jgi:hypothetical protein
MKKRRIHANLPLMMAQLSLASWEVVLRRTTMMAQNKCSPAEYRRMVAEKSAAAKATGALLASGRATAANLLTPWHSRATANAKRLRKG